MLVTQPCLSGGTHLCVLAFDLALMLGLSWRGEGVGVLGRLRSLLGRACSRLEKKPGLLLGVRGAPMEGAMRLWWGEVCVEVTTVVQPRASS